MEGHAHRRLPLVGAILVAFATQLALPLIAHAEGSDVGPPVDVWVDTNDDGVTVDAGTNQTSPGSGGSTGSGGNSSQPKCHLEELKPDEWDQDIELEYWGRRMHYAPYNLYCDGEWNGVVWIEIVLDEEGDPAPPPTSPENIARRLRDQLPIPQVTVDINPGAGVAGVESWFWLDGYKGTTLRKSTDAFGWLVQVEAQVTSYSWSFGDGTSMTSDSVGQAYPQRSSVRHVFERSSADFPDGYPIDVSFVFEVRYRVDGGGWISLPGITRTAHEDYQVRESQAVIEQ